MSRLTLLPTTPTEEYRTRRLGPWCLNTWSLTLRSYLDSDDVGNLIRVRAVGLPSLACLVHGRHTLNRHLAAVVAFMDHLEATPAHAGDVAFQHWTARPVSMDAGTVEWKVTIPTRIDVTRGQPR